MKTQTQQKILQLIIEQAPLGATKIAEKLEISTQMVHRHLKKLSDRELIYKTGNPPSVFYFPVKEKEDIIRILPYAEFSENDEIDNIKGLKKCILLDNNIRSIWMFTQNIGNRGCKKIAEVLNNKNCHIERLRIEYDEIGYEGFFALFEALKNTACIVYDLSLYNTCNTSDKEEKRKIGMLIGDFLSHKNCHLTYLNIGTNYLGNDAMRFIWKGLKDVHSLESGFMSCNVEDMQLQRELQVICEEKNIAINDF